MHTAKRSSMYFQNQHTCCFVQKLGHQQWQCSSYLKDALASQGLGQNNASEPKHGYTPVPVLSLRGPDTVCKGLLACVPPAHYHDFSSHIFAEHNNLALAML